MNIFILSENPQEAATMMLNKHVVKMPTESMQMLSTISNHLDFDSPYKPVMLNHPCTIWARESQDNFQWLIDHCKYLCQEYTLRYNKVHKVENTLYEYYNIFMEVKSYLPNVGLTSFALAMPEDYKQDSAVESYRTYYLEDKWWIAEWKYGSPEWWPNDHIIKKHRQRFKELELENKRIRGM